jgi:PII-like signaling protein
MKTLFLLACLLPFGLFAQSNAQNKVCKIISFRVEARNPGIEDRVLIDPIASELTRIFKFTETAMAPGQSILWRNENGFNKFKKLTKKELEQLTSNLEVVLLKVELEHRYNAVLGGLIKKSKRHVLRLKIAMFTNTGERVWYHKKKDSCCIDFGVDENDIQNDQMETGELFDLYTSLLKKGLSKL